MCWSPVASCALTRRRPWPTILCSRLPISAARKPPSNKSRLTMPLDLLLRNARIHGRGSATFDIGIAGGAIADIGQITADAPVEDAGGRLVTAGFVETH